MGDASKRVHGAVTQFHRGEASSTGISKEELRSRELGGAPSFVLDAVLDRTKTVVAEGDVVRLASHRVTLKQDEEAASAKIESAFAVAGLAVPSTSEVLARSGWNRCGRNRCCRFCSRAGDSCGLATSWSFTRWR